MFVVHPPEHKFLPYHGEYYLYTHLRQKNEEHGKSPDGLQGVEGKAARFPGALCRASEERYKVDPPCWMDLITEALDVVGVRLIRDCLEVNIERGKLQTML